MKNTISKILILVFLLSTICTSAFALSEYDDGSKVIDYYDVLTDEEEAKLETEIQNYIDKYEIDMEILLVSDERYTSPQEDAEEYLFNTDMGYGDNRDAVLLYFNFETRKYRMITHGKAISIYTDYGIEKISDAYVSDISEGDYYKGLTKFISSCSTFADEYNETGEAYDVDNTYFQITLKKELVLLGIGLALSAIALIVMHMSMNTAVEATYAGDYIVPDSFKLYRQKDNYMYSHTSRTKKAKSNSSSGGGGSSVSSGGCGGGGGDF